MSIGLKVAEGREAEVYTWDGDAVLKLYRPGYLGHVAEAAALAALEAVGVVCLKQISRERCCCSRQIPCPVLRCCFAA